MFNSDQRVAADSADKQKKLPKAIQMMVDKGNIVMAIKTLAADEHISMDAAKARIDAYEANLKTEQQQTLNKIASKQGIPTQALSSDRTSELAEPLVKDKVKTTQSARGFQTLQRGVESQLGEISYKKPLIPYWLKRLMVITIIVVGLSWILWRVFT